MIYHVYSLLLNEHLISSFLYVSSFLKEENPLFSRHCQPLPKSSPPPFLPPSPQSHVQCFICFLSCNRECLSSWCRLTPPRPWPGCVLGTRSFRSMVRTAPAGAWTRPTRPWRLQPRPASSWWSGTGEECVMRICKGNNSVSWTLYQALLFSTCLTNAPKLPFWFNLSHCYIKPMKSKTLKCSFLSNLILRPLLSLMCTVTMVTGVKNGL